MRRVAAAAVLTAALVGLPATAMAKSRVVFAGGTPKFQKSIGRKYNSEALTFFNDRVTINAGDTVDWNGAALSGGFHTVDIPKLNGQDLALITSTGKTAQGVKDAAGNPFWFDGKVPVLGFNTALLGASGPVGGYNGTTRVDSGLPLSPKPHDFKVRFLTPGVYKYFCDVHPGMIGYVVVKAKGKPVPSAKQDAAEIAREQRHYLAVAKTAQHPPVAPNHVSVGNAKGGVDVLAIFPAVLHVKRGSVVTFSMARASHETHSVTFGKAPYLGALVKSFNSPAIDPKGIYPSDPPGHIVLSATSHGNGFANLGVLDRDPATPAVPSSGTIKFTQAGTYHFICLIHPFMHGTVVVK